MEKKVTDYSLAIAYTWRDLITLVDKQMKEGWQPFGGICVQQITLPNTQGNYWQAMVKYEK